MEGRGTSFCALTLAALLLQEVAGLSLRNEQSGKCVQIQDSQDHGTISLEECKPGSALQEWRWSSERQTLRNPKTGKCLTAVQIQEQELIRLRACRPEEEEGQAWSCSRKGHLTLHGKGFHLSAHLDSSSVFLSAERGRSSKWRTLNKQIVCEEEEAEAEGTPEPEKPVPRIIAKIRFWQPPVNHDPPPFKPTQPAQISSAPPETNSSMDASPNQFSLEYGLGWKVTMLVLSSLALLLGTVILILNVYQNRRRKTVVVLKSYSSKETISQPGSPVPSERAPLTKHPMRPPRSPSIQRGEILVEWKDGTVTPLFDTYLTS
uniref:Si:dkey-245n4.2 n=1 Tax=Astyanax mexicanus TaxID=7994 RepID=A0A3B1IJD2_ASTMX